MIASVLPYDKNFANKEDSLEEEKNLIIRNNPEFFDSKENLKSNEIEYVIFETEKTNCNVNSDYWLWLGIRNSGIVSKGMERAAVNLYQNFTLKLTLDQHNYSTSIISPPHIGLFSAIVIMFVLYFGIIRKYHLRLFNL